MIFPEEEIGILREETEDVCVDVLMEEGRPVFHDGLPVLVEGAQAICGWAWRALHTPKGAHSIYGAAYGCEIPDAVGSGSIDAQRMVMETLEQNPHILGIENVEVERDGSALRISATIETEYGELETGV